MSDDLNLITLDVPSDFYLICRGACEQLPYGVVKLMTLPDIVEDNPPETYSVGLTSEHWNLIINMLSEFKYKQVASTIKFLNESAEQYNTRYNEKNNDLKV